MSPERTPTTSERIVKWVAIALSVLVGLVWLSGTWLWPDWLPWVS